MKRHLLLHLLVLRFLTAPVLAADEPPEHGCLRGHRRPVTWLVFTRDGKRLVSATSTKEEPGELKVWDTTTGREVLSLTPKGKDLRVAVAPDGSRLAWWPDYVSNASVRKPGELWDVQGARRIAILHCPEWLWGADFLRNGETLITQGTSDGSPELVIWDARSGARRATLHGDLDSATSDGNVVLFSEEPGNASVSENTRPRFLDLKRLTEQPIAWERRTVDSWSALAPDGKTVALSGPYDQVELWDVLSAKKRSRLSTFQWSRSDSGYFSPDSHLLALNGMTRTTLVLWDVATAKPVASLGWNGQEDEWMVQDLINATFAPDSRTLATGHKSGAIRLWEVATGRERAMLHPRSASGAYLLGFTPDGRALFSSLTFHHPTTQGAREPGEYRLALWDLAKPDVHATWPIKRVWRLTEDRSLLAIAQPDGSIKLWNVARLLDSK